ncbi:MAG TPA: deacetylase [Firmicutes bacterium]|jgi:polysaccharide deacetylase family sporulation protein PdaB|nr:polysaccharide deacetylase family protein [Bacillota bacterium]HAA35154.1 deacetylase [Bacillota bacterium]
MRKIFFISRKKLKIALLLPASLFALYLIYAFFFPYALPMVTRQNRLVPIYYVDTSEKKVAFSFDASWGATYTPTILEILQENNIKTTFFLTGFWVEKYPNMVKKIFQEGHEIGNHTYSHPHLNTLSEEEIMIEIERVGNKILELTGKQPELFRPPFGEYSNKVVTAAEKCGYKSIQWSIDSLDWQELGKEPMVKRVTESLHPGAIILFHNNGKYTAEALPEIIAFVKEQSYKVVPVSELLYKENYYIDSNTGAQIQMPLQD